MFPPWREYFLLTRSSTLCIVATVSVFPSCLRRLRRHRTARSWAENLSGAAEQRTRRDPASWGPSRAWTYGSRRASKQAAERTYNFSSLEGGGRNPPYA